MAWILSLLSFAALLILAMYNPEWVTVKFLVWQANLPLVGLVLAAAALGGLMVGAYAAVRSFGAARRNRAANDRARQLEQDLARSKEQARHLEQEVAHLRSSAQGNGTPAGGLPTEGAE